MTRILASAEDADRSTNEERRASPRYPVRLRVGCHASGPKICATQTGRVREISTLGIGILIAIRVELSSFLEIELLAPNGQTLRRLQARVVHVEEENSDEWLIGCAFVSELSPAELALFRADAVAPAGPDHRRWTRFPCNVETVCYTCETAPGERRSGRILNVSAGGIGLLLRCCFTQGTLLHFEMPGASDTAPRPTLIRVARVLEHTRGNWFLGCEFAAQLSDQELQSLIAL